MAERSGVRIVLDAAHAALFPGALEYAAAGVRTGGDPRNRDFAGPHVETDGVAEELLALAYDPQTSGGLLIALPAEKGAVLGPRSPAQELFLARIGRVVEGAGVELA